MAVIEEILNGVEFGINRSSLNNNFTALNNDKLEAAQVLTKVNNTPFTPTEDYHPSTKLYVDDIQTNWHNVYNPQAISGDVFVRANHTGTQAPATIATDANNRFVTDTEKGVWNAKEPGIGTKGTAFNKNFGTIADSVSQGNHTHNKGDIGLGNVDNTSDLNKPVSTLQQAELDLKLSIDGESNFLDFDNDIASPAHKEGRLFYDEHHHALSYYNEEADVTLNIGQEMMTKVYNNTGVVIPNGSALYLNGTIDPTSHAAGVGLAKADDFDTARVMGIATQDIPNNGTGYACTVGELHDVDTSLFSVGSLLYLSDTVAGQVTTTAPDIVTILGYVKLSGAVDGVFFVSIDNIIALPNTYASLEGKSTTLTVTETYQNIASWDGHDDLGDVANSITGYITASKSGKYEATVNLTLSFASHVQARQLDIQIWDVTNSTQVGLSTISVAKDSTSGSRSFSKLFTAVEGHEYVLRVRRDSVGSDYVLTFADAGFYSISL